VTTKSKSHIPAGLTSTTTPAGIAAHDPDACLDPTHVLASGGSVVAWHCSDCRFDWTAHALAKKCPKCQSKKILGDPRPMTDAPDNSRPANVPVGAVIDSRSPAGPAQPDLVDEDLSQLSTVELGRRHLNGTGIAAQKAARAKRDAAPQAESFEEWRGKQKAFDVEITKVIPSPNNPRKTFDEKYIDELAASIEANGLLQRLTVHPPAEGRYELIAGECRLRALRKLYKKDKGRWGLVAIEVKEATVKQATILRLEENVRRQDLNPIDQARAYLDATTTGGFTQQELADSLHVVQGTIGNKLRLLKLPEIFQRKIITAEMSERRAREILKWADLPGVLEQAAAPYAKKPLPEDDWHLDRAIENAADELSRAMHQNAWSGSARKFKVAAAIEKELNVHKVGHEKRAFNTALWDKLQQEAEARAAKREKAAVVTERRETPAEQKAKAKKLADQFGKRLYSWKIRWLQTLYARELASRSAPETVLVKLLLHFAADGGGTHRRGNLDKAVRAAGGKNAHAKRDHWTTTDSWKSLATVEASALTNVVVDVLAAWVQFDFERAPFHFRPRDVEALAAELKIDLKKEWKVTEAFLQLHTKEQLLGLIAEWGNELPRLMATATRKEVIAFILSHHSAGKIPAEVLTAKGK
jgi:ParB/RepB/Spo0J family partition protein